VSLIRNYFIVFHIHKNCGNFLFPEKILMKLAREVRIQEKQNTESHV